MPDMNGFQLAETVRKEKAIKRTNLLMLTAAGQRGDGERCRELGIRGYLTKPMSRADLLEALGTVLAGPQEPGTPRSSRGTRSPSRAARCGCCSPKTIPSTSRWPWRCWSSAGTKSMS
jgi:DNA-binding response OmpR family regulator